MSDRELTFVLHRLCAMLQSDAFQTAATLGLRLQPVHIAMLQFLATCNRPSATPQGLVAYLGVTKGTVSQSLNRLEEKGLVERKRDRPDGREVRLELTPAGREVIAEIQAAMRLWRAVAVLPEAERRQFSQSLKSIVIELARQTDSPQFGICRTCRYCTSCAEGEFYCALLKVPISSDEAEKMCIEHTR